MLRLRQQVSDCGFDKYSEDVKDVLTEVFLIDAIIEGCQSQELRRRILQQDRALAEIEALGVTLEGIDNQVKGFGGRYKQNEADQRVFRIGAAQIPFHKRRNQQEQEKRKFGARDGIKCFNCARRDHISTSETCPARGKVCRTCKIVGHFESCCRSRKFGKAPAEAKKVRAVEESGPVALPGDESIESASKTYYTFHAGNESNVIACNVGGVQLNLLVDSGSDVNLIPDNVWEYLKQAKVTVQQCVKGSDKVLKGYANDNPLPILGTFRANVDVGQKTVQAEFYVIVGGQRSIFGDKTAKELGILYVGLHVNQIDSAVVPFPKIKDVQVQIHTDPDIKPVFQPVRRVPIPLEAAVDRKLDALLAMDIIEVKSGPATWVSPLVVVGKKNGEPRICLDLRRVNQAVLRERHPMPVVEEYLARLGKGTIWSKLDIKDAFLQVELAPESRDVTTFITNKGLFRFKRLPFGLVVAPELFQKVMDQILAGCEGTHWYLDDVIVEGKDLQEHDKRLNEVLKRFEDRSVLLNWDKCVFRAEKVEFIGHHISDEGILPSSSKIDAILSFRRPENASEVRSFFGSCQLFK
ncbi:uncharacterized protein K02A2.6-like [Aedes albopictus]|uniref:Reverse transcriptase domain-containing protein n=1 Tax=Aedes albopictus TaxID=7160 RepID=A0ABM1XVT9_AEDAL